MKITKRKIQAASDYRDFNGLSLDEVEESYPDLYYDVISDIRNDVDEVYLSNDPANFFVGVHDKNENRYYVLRTDIVDSGWYEVDFEELFKYLK